jgi:hypothetical protein
MVDVNQWSGNVVSEARLAGGAYQPMVDLEAVDGSTTIPPTLNTAFGPGVSFTGTNWTIGSVTKLDSLIGGLRLSALKQVSGEIADTGQDLNWDGTPIPTADSTFFSNILHRIVHGTPKGSGSDSSTLAERDATTADLTTPAVDEIAEQVNDSVWLATFGDYDNTLGTFGDSAQTWGATGGGGSCITGATIPFYVYTIDTSGTDDTLSLVGTSLYNSSGVFQYGLTTVSAGYVQYTVTSGTWRVTAMSIGYAFDDSSYVVTAEDTVALYGYSVPTTSAPAAKTCAVTINILNSDGTAAAGIPITMYLTRSNAIDSNGTPVYNQGRQGTTDSNGQVTFNCYWSSFLIPATDWMVSSPATGNLRKQIAVPRQTTYTIDFSQ